MIEALAARYIMDPKPRDTQIKAMKILPDWKYKGNLEKETVTQYCDRFKEVYSKCKQLKGHAVLSDIRRDDLLLSTFD